MDPGHARVGEEKRGREPAAGDALAAQVSAMTRSTTLALSRWATMQRTAYAVRLVNGAPHRPLTHGEATA